MKTYLSKFLLLLILSYHCQALAITYPHNITGSIHRQLEILETASGGRIGVYAVNTANNQLIQYRAAEHFPIQSTFKVMAVAAMLQKSMANPNLLQQKISYTKQDLVFWSPITEQHITNGMTIAELCAAAMEYTDNTATNLIMRELGGPTAITAFARSIGDNTFKINGWEPDLNSNPTNSDDTSTPTAIGKSLQKLTIGKVLTPALRNQLVIWMKNNTTGATRIRAGVPRDWIVADKTGASDSYGISNDIGIIWPPNCAPIVVAIYSDHHKKVAARRDDVVAAAARLITNEFAKTDSCL